MTERRFCELMDNDDAKLSEEEIKQGWHFCMEFDGLLYNSNDEAFTCDCNEFQRLY